MFAVGRRRRIPFKRMTMLMPKNALAPGGRHLTRASQVSKKGCSGVLHYWDVGLHSEAHLYSKFLFMRQTRRLKKVIRIHLLVCSHSATCANGPLQMALCQHSKVGVLAGIPPTPVPNTTEAPLLAIHAAMAKEPSSTALSIDSHFADRDPETTCILVGNDYTADWHSTKIAALLAMACMVVPENHPPNTSVAADTVLSGSCWPTQHAVMLAVPVLARHAWKHPCALLIWPLG